MRENEFVGLGGLTNIEWENSRAEISLIINPALRGRGYGEDSVKLLLREGFRNIGLNVIWGEVYNCANRGFWERCIENMPGESVEIPWSVKLWNGERYGAMMFAWESYKWFA
jgi:hypothetical protein